MRLAGAERRAAHKRQLLLGKSFRYCNVTSTAGGWLQELRTKN